MTATTPGSTPVSVSAPVSTPGSVAGSVAGSATTRREHRARTALLALQIVLALFYAFASATPKLLGISAASDSFDKIGFGDWFMYLTGALEFAGAVALLIPVLYQVAAVAMIGLMVGATVTQLTVFDGQNAATPIIMILPLAVIAWARRDSTPALLALLSRFRGARRPVATTERVARSEW
jgi:uncharacterized membrane protein YphA (DoxX/SURF4 family)